MLNRLKKLIPVKAKVSILNILPNTRKAGLKLIGKLSGIKIIKPNSKLPNYYMFRPVFDSNSMIVDVGCGFDADFSMFMIENYGLTAIGVDPTPKHKESLNKLVIESKGKFLHKSILISKTNGNIKFKESTENTSGSILDSHVNVQNKKINEYKIQSVNLAKLPEFLNLSQIRYIKLDIEGAEYELIDDLKKDDLVKYDQIFIEFHHHAIPSYSKEDTLKRVEKMKSLDFKAFTIDNHDFLFYRR